MTETITNCIICIPFHPYRHIGLNYLKGRRLRILSRDVRPKIIRERSAARLLPVTTIDLTRFNFLEFIDLYPGTYLNFEVFLK